MKNEPISQKHGLQPWEISTCEIENAEINLFTISSLFHLFQQSFN